MLRLLYTNANEFLGEQTVGDKSLGGLISSTPVPNSFLGNIFGDLSMKTIQSGLRECKCLAIHNFSDTPKEGIRLTIAPIEDQMFDIEVAITTPTVDPRGGLVFEKISDMRGLPVYANFYKSYSHYQKRVLNITSPPEIGEVVSLLYNGQTLVMVTSTTNTIEGLITQLQNAIQSNLFEVTINTPTSLLIRDRNITTQGYTISLDTEGTSFAASVTLSGGSDNSLVLPTLPPDGYYGLWLKRTIKQEFVGGFKDGEYLHLPTKTLIPKLVVSWN